MTQCHNQSRGSWHWEALNLLRSKNIENKTVFCLAKTHSCQAKTHLCPAKTNVCCRKHKCVWRRHICVWPETHLCLAKTIYVRRRHICVWRQHICVWRRLCGHAIPLMRHTLFEWLKNVLQNFRDFSAFLCISFANGNMEFSEMIASAVAIETTRKSLKSKLSSWFLGHLKSQMGNSS